ncbi:MAG TPA: glutamine amidotransferase, partial [Staphylococcus sp.]|nr:glutamine amidotransferase [Staphylococcus sp.]
EPEQLDNTVEEAAKQAIIKRLLKAK